MKYTDFFAKDITWVKDSEMLDVLSAGAILAESGQITHEVMQQSVALMAHGSIGTQMWVSKEVTDDLMETRMSGVDFSTVNWPACSVEFVFEDPTIPNFVLRYDAQDATMAWLCGLLKLPPQVPKTETDPRKFLLILLCDRTPVAAGGPLIATASHTVAEFSEFAGGGGEIEELEETGGMQKLTGGEVAAMRDLALLAFKVLAFASIPQFAPVKHEGPVSKREGGKPGFMGRPRTDRLVVKYLPAQIVELRKQAAARAARGGRNFRGRHGHIRYFRSDRFVNLKGTWTFVAPSYGPDGTLPKRKFKVVRPR